MRRPPTTMTYPLGYRMTERRIRSSVKPPCRPKKALADLHAHGLHSRHGDCRVPPTSHGLDTTSTPSPYRPSGLVGGHPFTGVVRSFGRRCAGWNAELGEAEKTIAVDSYPPVAARQEPHGRQNAAQQVACPKAYPRTQLPVSAGASCLSHNPPVQAGSEPPPSAPPWDRSA